VKEVRFTKMFKKDLIKQSPKLQQRFWERLQLWQEQPLNPLLYHHLLKGDFAGLHSINITGDVRAVYDEFDNEIVLYVMIGSHSQLYG